MTTTITQPILESLTADEFLEAMRLGQLWQGLATGVLACREYILLKAGPRPVEPPDDASGDAVLAWDKAMDAWLEADLAARVVVRPGLLTVPLGAVERDLHALVERAADGPTSRGVVGDVLRGLLGGDNPVVAAVFVP